ncbi:hypothetical protein HBI66_044140 [Parastagonospora nodorum]|nr:hypothetical protein HBI66_044140 [Parastagonospora nodorum]
MCAKNDLIRRKSLLLISTQTPNYVNTFSLDFTFLFANILLLIAFIISYYLFADKLRLTPSTLLARFIPTTKICDPFLKTLENTAKSRILLACADRRIRQCYLTICAILKHYNFNIYISLATDILHLLLKGLVIKMLDFMQDILDNIYSSKQKAIIQQLIAVVSLLFVLKAPFALHFIRAVCDLVILAALDSIYTRANSEAYYITILILGIQPYLIKLPLSEVAANIVISNFIHTAVQSSSKRHNNSKHYNKEILQAFKFYDLSTIICLVHLVLRDLPNLTTHTTMSYYVNNYIN